ncbi:MAG: hypothetical protein MK102_15480 [Fuerstiella sp.]|nr:hypothetical protein [Fuerstiella sp.]
MVYLSLLFFLFTFLAFLFVWRMLSGGRMVVTPLVVFAGFEFLCTWPATVYFQEFGNASVYAALLVAAAFLSFLFGYLLWMSVVARRSGLLRRFLDKPLVCRQSPMAVLFAVTVTTVSLMAVGVYHFRGVPPVVSTFSQLLQGDGYSDSISELSAARYDNTKGHYFGEKYRGGGLVQTVFGVGFPYLVLVTLFMSACTRKRVWLFLTIALAVLMVVFVGGSGQRFQIIMAVACIAVGGNICFGWSARRAFGSGLMLGCIMLLATPLSSQMIGVDSEENALLFTVTRAFERICLGNGTHSLEVLDFVDSGALELGYGSIHLQKFISALPGVSYGTPFSSRVQQMRGGTSTAFASMNYYAVLYADFGAIGVLVGYMIIGILAAATELIFFGSEKDVMYVPAYAVAVVLFSDLSIGGSASVVASGFILVVFTAGMLKIAAIGDSIFLGKRVAKGLS